MKNCKMCIGHHCRRDYALGSMAAHNLELLSKIRACRWAHWRGKAGPFEMSQRALLSAMRRRFARASDPSGR